MYHPRLKGKHYDMGRHYGELLAKSGIDLSSVMRFVKATLQNPSSGLTLVLHGE